MYTKHREKILNYEATYGNLNGKAGPRGDMIAAANRDYRLSGTSHEISVLQTELTPAANTLMAEYIKDEYGVDRDFNPLNIQVAHKDFSCVLLGEDTSDGSSLYIAVATLSLVEVSPRSSHLPFVVRCALVWLQVYPDATFFWIDHDIGRRVCVWIETVLRLEPALLDLDKPIRSDVDKLLSELVSLGVADARRLEEALS